MADSFDPYSKWLGIQDGGPTPDHYRLFGLQQFEPDADLIGRAADAVMARVRRIKPGPHLAKWSHLLDQLGQAKNCLLNAASKKAYDQSLANRTSNRAMSGAMPVAKRISPAQAAQKKSSATLPRAQCEALGQAPLLNDALLADFGPVELGPAPVVPSRPASSPMWPIFVASGVLVFIVLAVIFYSMHRRAAVAVKYEDASVTTSGLAEPPSSSSSASAPPPPPAPPSPTTPSVQPPPPPTAAFPPMGAPVPGRSFESLPKLETEQPRPPKLVAKKPKLEAADPTIDIGANMTTAFAKAVADVRTALADRDMEAAARHLESASNEIKTVENRELIDRLETMHENLTQFWSGIQASMAKLQAAEELVIKEKRIVVVDSSRDFLKVKVEGRVHTFEIATMPASLIMAMVEQYFGRDAGSKAVIGTFLAVDPNGDRTLAKQYMREAASAGIDCEKLLPEIDAMPPAVNRKGPAMHKGVGR